jgi:glycosyltransferase involved in cell wall biosynthesis
MILLDVTTFFSNRAGGIRTYHLAKINYFGRQSAHRYFLVYPGAEHSLSRRGPSVTMVSVYGPKISKDRNGYRFLIDYLRVFRIIRAVKPAAVEVGDPWLTGLFCLLIKKIGLYRGLLACFYHSDPILTHLSPWSGRGHAQLLKRLLVVRPLGALFYRVQRAYDITIVASEVMEQRLASCGVPTMRLTLGVPALFLDGAPPARPRISETAREIRLLYAGRLNPEKGIELVKGLLQRVLALPDVRVTVIGRGPAADYFAAVGHPRFRYLGFIEDQMRVREMYDEHDILLAPGPFDSFGLGVVEAMARGLVVVGPDQGGTAELLYRMKSPFLFRSEDPDDFYRAVRLAMECDLAAESARSRLVAEEYGTLEQAVSRLIEFYASRTGQTGSESDP